MKLLTLIVDDEPIGLEKLAKYVEKVPFLKLAGACSSGLDAIALMADTQVDVVFSDINMPDLSGIDFVSSLSSAPLVVFITAHAQYAVESYKLDAVDYLLKPYGFADFQRAANKVLDQYMARHRDIQVAAPLQRERESLFVKADYRYVRVDLASIRYIKGYGEYLQIFTDNATAPLMTLSSFADIKERLTGNFIQIHRSYIVNMNQVESVSRGRVVMDSDTYIPVGDSYKNAFQNYLQEHSVGAGKKS